MLCACGEKWWELAIIVDAATQRIAGYSMPLRCRSCGAQGDFSLTLLPEQAPDTQGAPVSGR